MRWRDLSGGHRSHLDELAGRDPYEILDVKREMPRAEIRRAYLARVRVYHPDRVDPFLQSVAQEMLKLLNRAWEAIEREQADGR
jgi:curved DNA-binding protein CbpA